MLLECVVNEIIVYKTTPQKVYVLTVENPNTLAAITRLKGNFPTIGFEVIYVPEFDVVEIAKIVDGIIKKEKGNQININVTEGRKTMVLAGVFAASLNKEVVEGAFYLRQDNHDLMPIPLPNFELSETKLKILDELNKGIKKVGEINTQVKIHRSLIYANLKELMKGGYITKDKLVTDSGKICLLRRNG